VALIRRLTLDTSAYSHFRRGHREVLERLATAQEIILPTIVLGELHGGFRSGSRFLENEASLERFLEEPFVSVVDVDREVAARYGELFAALKRKGTPIPTNDIWIAAIVLVTGTHLLTFDDDFKQVPGLSWTRFHPKR
jgi:predicted nucleic acid-binding protein